MKTIIDFCKKYNLEFREVRFKAHGSTSKGYDIYNPNTKCILITIEPVNYSNGDRWLFIDYVTGNNQYQSSSFYSKNITGLNNITPVLINKETGHVISK